MQLTVSAAPHLSNIYLHGIIPRIENPKSMGRTDMTGTFHRYNVDKAIGLSIGFLIGVIPVAEYNIPVLIILLSVIFGIKHIDRQSAKAAFPIILYCVSMIGLMTYHPGWLEYDHTLATILATIALAAVPMVAMFKIYVGSVERIETAALVGLLTIFTIMAYQYLILNGCRVKAFSVNPLGPPITFLPFAIYVISVRAFARRFNLLDGLVLVSLFIALGAFAGARASFYSVTLLSIILATFLFFNMKIRQGLFVCTCLGLGIWGAFSLDKCGDFNRMSNHFQMLKIYIPVEKATPEMAAEEKVSQMASQIPTPTATSSTKQLSPDTQPNVTLEKTPEVSKFIDRVNKAQAIEGSSGYRSQKWRNAIDHLLQRNQLNEILFGSGRLVESSLSMQFPDVHNQYLSWLVSTGVVGFLVAFLMFTPALRQLFINPAIFIFLSGCAIGYITDSSMFRKDTTAQFLIMLLFVQSLLGQRRRS